MIKQELETNLVIWLLQKVCNNNNNIILCINKEINPYQKFKCLNTIKMMMLKN